LARSDELVIEELGDELLVYDLAADNAHSLSATAAQVWRRCDGEATAVALSVELGLDQPTIERALDELERCELLDTGPMPAAGTTRRDFGLKIAKVGAATAAMPLIFSVAGPVAEAAGSVTVAFCTGNGLSHGCGADCMSRNCCCCCQGTSTPPSACNGSTMCCLPTTQCDALVWGPSSHCSATAPCP
jgi:hypothetical protein